MTKEKFKELLEEADINRKDFARILKCSPQTVNNWGSTQNIPYWVESWLENYIERKKFENMKTIMKKSGICS
jgi:DNA-binding transcriptional regulator YiaG